jgi:hypothetical protein
MYRLIASIVLVLVIFGVLYLKNNVGSEQQSESTTVNEPTTNDSINLK